MYPKGSYPNFTNVVRDSDVDIAVELQTGISAVAEPLKRLFSFVH
ncbi:MAG TPA: hypothetical protein VGI73_04460 [Solirubrobacterales bacterium]